MKYLHILVSLSLSLGITSVFGQAKQSNTARSATKPSMDVSKKVKFKDKTEVNFDDTAIDGNVKSPFGTMIGNRDQEFNKGFIKLRTHWHDQMVTSVSGISQ